MNLKYFLLGSLYEQPLHGYEMKSPWFKSIFKEFGINNNQLYPTLKKMVEENLIEKEVVIQDGKPNKHIYSITEDGKKAFFDWIVSTEGEERSYRYESFISEQFMMRMNYADVLNAYRCSEKINKQIQYVKETLSDLKKAKEEMVEKKLKPIRIKLIEYGIMQLETRLIWLENLLEDIPLICSSES